MAKFRNVTIDTNFFISGFGENPQAYNQLDRIFKKLKIKVFIPDYVQKEMRWYMRRSIEPHLTVNKINPGKLKKFEDDTRKQVNIGLPQTPDMAVAYLAKQKNLTVISSDLRLVEVSQAIDLVAFMNSAFLIMLLEEIKDGPDRDYLQILYHTLIEDEIRHSVKSQNKYDPVIRIQKIMDSAMSAIKRQATIEQSNEIGDIKQNYDFPEYRQLIMETTRIRTDISEYISAMEGGNLRAVRVELNESINLLSDLLIEMQLAQVNHEDEALVETTTTLGHILLLASAVALMDRRLDDASALIAQLSILSTQNERLQEKLDIDIHLQRLTIFFLTEQFDRFKIYFTPFFQSLCEKREREDILSLYRTMAIIMTVLTYKEVQPSATAKDFSEIQFIIQLGVQFISLDKVENAWILLEQALYMSLNSKLTGLLLAVFEVLLPLSFKLDNRSKYDFMKILRMVKKRIKKLPFDDYERRAMRNEIVDESLLRRRTVSLKRFPSNITGFLDVISSEHADFKKIGRCTFVRVVDWNTMNFIGIVDPTTSLGVNLTVGDSVKIQKGSARIIKATGSVKEKRGVDMIVICKTDKLQFIVRRAGQVQVVQSRVGEYDL